MKKNIFRLLYLAFATVFLINCDNQTQEVDAAPINAECYLRYLQDQNESLSEVTIYKKPDSIPQIVEVEEVRINGNAMNPRDVSGYGTRYQFSQQLLPGKEVTWSIKNTEQQIPVESSLSVAAVTSFSFPSGISKKEGALLKMDTDLFSSNESLRLLFTPETGKTASVEIPGMPGKNEIHIPGEALISLTTGPNKVEIVRKKLLVDKVGNITFKKVGEFYTRAVPVVVTE